MLPCWANDIISGHMSSFGQQIKEPVLTLPLTFLSATLTSIFKEGSCMHISMEVKMSVWMLGGGESSYNGRLRL